MRIRALALCVLLLGTACKSREPDYYTLSSVPGKPLPGQHLTLKLRRPAIDITLDRPQMVRMDSTYRIKYDNGAQWSEPLDRMLERVLAQDIEERLPGSVVVTESGQMVTEADGAIDLDVRQFGVGADGRAIVQAVSLVSRTGEKNGVPHSVMLTGGQGSTGKAAAQSLSELLGELSDKIAADVRKGKRK
ncbi:MAG TPA: PqiC family protein [Rickettsiales bacterium]|nr:PqiC family protein [Rickettsiales bacterium]